MFGLSKKEKARKALQRGTEAVLRDGLVQIQRAEVFGLNEQAAAWLYSETLTHQIYVLTLIANNRLSKRFAWATHEFVVRAINEAITDFEVQQGSTPGSISSFIFRGCAHIDDLTPKERGEGEHFRRSARKISELDPSGDEAQLIEWLGSVARNYFDVALKMFD